MIEVRGVGVLAGMPRAQCGAVIAHELGHAFMHLTLFGRRLQRRQSASAPAVVEGLCELFAHLYLQSLFDVTAFRGAEVGAGREAGDAASARLFMALMKSNADPVYGGGYRSALAAYGNMILPKEGDCLPLPALLRHVSRTGTLPRGRWKPTRA